MEDVRLLIEITLGIIFFYKFRKSKFLVDALITAIELYSRRTGSPEIKQSAGGQAEKYGVWVDLDKAVDKLGLKHGEEEEDGA